MQAVEFRKDIVEMKYFINKSFNMAQLTNSTQIVVCDDIFRKYECDIEVLNNVLQLVNKYGDIEHVYEYYNSIYNREEIDEYISILIDERVIVEAPEYSMERVKLALIGDYNACLLLQQVRTDRFDYMFFSSPEDFAECSTQFDGLIWLPGKMTYSDMLKYNKLLYKKETPFVICRYTGKDYIIGPLVFPWKTTCLECHANLHLMIINDGDGTSVTLKDIENLYYSQPFPCSVNNPDLIYSFQVILQDMEKLILDNSEYQLINKELHLKDGLRGNPVIKTFACTTACSCCHGKNRNYVEWSNHSNHNVINAPLFPALDSQTDIKYTVGGLRSLSSEDAKHLVETALRKLGVDVQIKRGEENAISSIIPVFHSILRPSHSAQFPYFLEAQHSYGKGLNPQQAYFSAAFELFERLSARYYGEKEVICGTYSDLKDWCADFQDFYNIQENVQTIYDGFDISQNIDWIWAFSLVDKRPKLIPASLAFLSKDVFKGNFAPNGSSGMSAGGTLKDAILQGLFEVVEHDAWMIGQANTVRLPMITYDGIKNAELKDRIQKIKAAGYNIISRNYTNDLGIPVIRTWISNPSSYVHYATSGLGASIFPEIALERSVTEAVQSGASSIPKDLTDYSRPIMKDLINARDGLYSLFYFQQKDIAPVGEHVDISRLSGESVETVDDALNSVISKIRSIDAEADVLFVDFTRPSIGIPAVKVFVTKGLQILREPLLSISSRLINFQQRMGYSDGCAKYEELYMGPYPH